MKISGGKHTNKTPLLFDALEYDKFPPSIANLPAAMTINGQTVYPTFRYKGGDATSTIWKPWGYGQTLTLVGAGTAPTYNNGSPLLGRSDDSVLFNGSGGAVASGRTYNASAGTFADLSTEDQVLEVIWRHSATVGTIIIKGAGVVGYQIYPLSATTCVYQMALTAVTATSLVVGSIYHGLVFIDRSGNAQWYVNGVVNGSAVDISAVTSQTNAGLLSFGGYASNQLYGSDTALYYCAMWQKNNWLDTHLQATVAQTRFAQLTGIYPQLARGTTKLPTFTRATTGYVDKIENNGTRKLYQVGAGWPRSCSRIDNKGKLVKGYLSEKTATNLALRSENIAGWAQYYTTTTAAQAIAPDGTLTAAKVVETANDIQHSIYSTITHVATLNNFSVFAKAAERSFIFLYGAADVTKAAWFNLTNGTIGTVGAGTTAKMENYGNGWYRCSIAHAATAAALEVDIGISSTDNVRNYAGDITKGVYLWGVQFTQNDAFPVSYISSSLTTATRNADQLQYTMNDGNLQQKQGSLLYNCLIPSSSISSSINPVTLSNAGSTTVNIKSIISKETTNVSFPSIPKTWTKTVAGDSFGTDVLAPDGTTTAAAWILNATSTAHGIVPTVSTASGILTVFSVFIKNGPLAKNWACLAGNAGGVTAYFNISTGVKGTVSATATADIESCGNGWYRCWISYTSNATGCRIYAADGNEDVTAAGDGATVYVYTWGGQQEAGAIPTPLISTTSAAVSRYYNTHNLRVRDTGINFDYTGTSNITTGELVKVVDNWKINDANLYVNNTAEGTKVTYNTGSVPTITRLDVSDEVGTNQINGLINNIKIYKGPLSKE